MMWFKNFISLHILSLALFLNTCAKMAKVTPDKDPGICDSNSRGKRIIVVDRDNNDRLIVCIRNNGVFAWKALDNLPTFGEYFHPAADCFEITEKNKDAKDGFYWIKTSGSQNVTKVWCDVTTDGGGFMLIGHQDSPVSWNVSSHPSVVAPDGTPHWSSSLGDASMLEFRIQISTTESPKQSRVDWLYQFKSARQLKQLFVDKQGCTTNHPGIANIEYVKDLLSEKVVTQTFECSRFGPSYPSQLGWKRMNKCFTQACKEGYAIIPGLLGFQYDNFGSFSYSTNSQTSGTSHNYTTFVGCDNGECCACFGPKGATGDFCSPRCGSINGGTVTKNVHVLFWIRSSVPKRPFLKKCMEYIVKTNQGNEETHFIDGKTGVLKKGSCSQKGVENLIDGVVQVANKAGLDNVPLVKGLLSYRKDNEKIYLTNGRSWTALGEEKQLEMLKTNVSELVAAISEWQKKIKLLELTNQILVKSAKSVKKNFSELAAANAESQKNVKRLELTNRILVKSVKKNFSELVAANAESQKNVKRLELTNRNLVKSVKKNFSELVAANAELQKKVKVLELIHHPNATNKTDPNATNKTDPNATNKTDAVNRRALSCAVLYKKGERKDGVYTINLDDGFGAFKVRCDMSTSGGGWTVFQRRFDGCVDFYRGWKDYKNGFGDLNGEFWLGLDKINRLSKSGGNYLRVDLEDFSAAKRYAQYSTFSVSNEADKYELTVGGFSGNAGDSLKYHNGIKFSAKDADNDRSSANCAVIFKGAWWYNNCRFSNLNGRYLRGISNQEGVSWDDWKGWSYSLKKTEMKIRLHSF